MTTLILPISITSEAIWSGEADVNFYQFYLLRTKLYHLNNKHLQPKISGIHLKLI